MRRGRLLQAALSLVVVAACVFLVLPTLAVIPISFTRTDFITFPPHGFSLRWYAVFFDSPQWRGAMATSFAVALAVTVLATSLGTLAAVGLRRLSRAAARGAVSILLLPMIVPTIITAVALYGALARVGLTGTRLGIVLAHTILALPFVVINVSAVIQKVDWRIVDAARSLGATPAIAFFRVTLPVIAPGVLAGAVFAFLTSFDEIVVALFLSGVHAVTLPVQMWSGIRFEISPAVAAAACLLLLFSLCLLTASLLVRRR